MRIISFSCRNLNSFINKDFSFFEDVTFLHGINGSGKTTILRAIASLLTPDPIWLANASFDSLKVTVQHGDKEFSISTTRNDILIFVEISGFKTLSDEISIEQIKRLSDQDDDEPYAWTIDSEGLVKRVRAFTQSKETFAFVSSLPTPIFLGLDRTTLSPSAIPRSHRPQPRAMQTYFRTQLDDAIVEAERLLTKQLTSLSVERNKIFATLRNQLVLSPFSTPQEWNMDPTKIEGLIIELEKIESSVISALEKINIGSKDIADRVHPFFREAVSSAKNASIGYQELNKIQKSKDRFGAEWTSIYVKKISPFLNIVPSISIIMHTLSNIEETNRLEKLLSRPLETYQTIMQSFFGEFWKNFTFSGKFN